MPNNTPENINRISGYHSKYKGSEVEDALDRVRLNLDGEFQGIKDLISEENQRAETEEQILADNLEAESDRAKAAERLLMDGLSDEVQRAKDAEQALTEDLDTEVNRASQAEQVLTDNLNSEIDRATTAETNLRNALNTEIADREKAVSDLADDLKEQMTAAFHYKGSVAVPNDLKSITNPQVGDLYNCKKDGTNFVYAGYDEDGNPLGDQKGALACWDRTSSLLDAEGIEQNAADISAETIRATGIEAGLRTDLTAEVNRATGEEERIENKFDKAVKDEQDRAKGVEGSLTSDLSTEVTRAQAAEKTISDNLTSEITRATTIENNLEDRITYLEEWSQGAVTAGDAIALDENNKIDVKYDGNTLKINEDNELYVDNLQHTLIAGDNIAINENNTISVVDITNIGKSGSSVVFYAQNQTPPRDLEEELYAWVGGNQVVYTKTENLPYDGFEYPISRFFVNSSGVPIKSIIGETYVRFPTSGVAEVGGIWLRKTPSKNIVPIDFIDSLQYPDGKVYKIKVEEYEDSIETLKTGLQEEVNRSTTAELAVQSNLTTEVSRATDAEKSLQDRIEILEVGLPAAEGNVSTSIEQELKRAKAAEEALDTKISDEITRAKGEETTLTSLIAAEETRATNVEEALNTRISSLETNEANKQLKSNIVTSLDGSSTDEQYPSAKCVYDILNGLKEALEDL